MLILFELLNIILFSGQELKFNIMLKFPITSSNACSNAADV